MRAWVALLGRIVATPLLRLDPASQRNLRVIDVAAELDAARSGAFRSPSTQRGDRYAEQFGDVIDVEELELVILVVVHGGSFRLLLAFVCRH